MKILFVCNSLGGGGAQKLLNDLLPILVHKEGIEAELLLITKNDDKYSQNLISKGVKISVIPAKYSNHLSRLRYIYNYIKENEFDIVHANLFPTFYYCSIVKKLLRNSKTKFAMTEHSTDNRRRHISLARPLEKWIYKAYDKGICISLETKTALCSWLVDNSINKFPVVYNGVVLKQYSQAVPYQRSEIFNTIADDDILLCMVGSFSNQKNHLFMIDVLTKLPERYKIVFCGEGKLRNNIEQAVSKYKLNERVKFLGFRTDAASIMHTSDIVIIPSKWEGFGLVAVEAMACGKPVVCSNVPGLTGVVGDAGIIESIDDPAVFAKAILRLENHELYELFSKRAYLRAQQFDINEMCERYLEVFNFYG